MSLRHLTLLAGAFGVLCAILAFTRPDGGWEWVPAISGLAFFGTLAGRRVTRVPYHNTGPALALALVIPVYHVIASFNRGRPANLPELAIDRAIQVEPAWMLVYGSVFLFAFLPAFVVRGPELTRRVLWSFISVEVLAFIGYVVYPTSLPRPAITAEGLFPWSLQLIYDIDPPRNCFPSLHVAWAFVAALSCYRVHRGVGLVAIGWASLIGVSTLYTEQHYVVDVIAGVMMACLAYLFFLRGHDRTSLAPSDVQRAPRRAIRMVWAYVGVIAAVVGAYLA
ncbi:MAG TPA: phosphatase PAP2 family protein [Gemmatimonadaceae bacterium]|nr:phosphatase PAP2 family protein [Gemmatimonadaceae bacterium]